MAITIDWRGKLKPNSTSPAFTPDWKEGDRPAGGAGTYVISGLTGLGTKTGTPYYENFEARTTGSLSGPVGSLMISNTPGGSITNTFAHSGSKSIRHAFASEHFPKHYLPLSGTQRKVRCSCWLYIEGASGTSGDNNVWKFARAGAGNPYDGYPAFRPSYTSGSLATVPNAFSGEVRDEDGGMAGYSAQNTSVIEPATAFTTGAWHYCRWLYDFGTVGGSDGVMIERCDHKETVNIVNRAVLIREPAKYPEWMFTPMDGFDDEVPGSLVFHLDELLIDESWCAWVITDNSSWAASNKFSEQIINSWGSSASANKRRGMFSVGETAYHHLFNSSGVLTHTSAAFTVTEDNA